MLALLPALFPRVQAGARRYPLVLIACGVLLYSSGPVLLQASDLSGPLFSFWRLWMGVVVLGVATAVQHRMGVAWPGRAQWRWALASGAAFGTHQLLFFSAIRLTTVVDVALMNALAPVVTAIGAYWMFGERPGRSFWSWAAVAIAGAALLALAAANAPAGNVPGMVMAVVNVVFFSIFFLVSKKGRDHIAVVPFLFGTMLVAALLVSGFVTLSGAQPGVATGRDLLLAGAVAVGPGALGHLIMTWPLRYVPANIPPVMRLAQPACSGVLAWWLLGEPLSWRHLFGGLLVIAGAAGTVLGRGGRALRADAMRGSHS